MKTASTLIVVGGLLCLAGCSQQSLNAFADGITGGYRPSADPNYQESLWQMYVKGQLSKETYNATLDRYAVKGRRAKYPEFEQITKNPRKAIYYYHILNGDMRKWNDAEYRKWEKSAYGNNWDLYD